MSNLRNAHVALSILTVKGHKGGRGMAESGPMAAVVFVGRATFNLAMGFYKGIGVRAGTPNYLYSHHYYT